MATVNEEATKSKQHARWQGNHTNGDASGGSKARNGKANVNDRHGYCFENIPQGLMIVPHWGVWQREYQHGKTQHVPFDAKTGRNLSVTDPETWSAYEVALDTYCRGLRGQWDGISVVLKELDGTVGLDIDDCVDENGDLTPEAQDIVNRWGSYLEYSPSRRGIRGFAYGTLPAGRRKVGNLEIYDGAKALTVTGWHLPGTPKILEERTDAIREIHAKFFTKPTKQHAKGTCNPDDYEPLTDEEVIDIALRAKNGVRVQALMDGDFSGYASNSEADLALCSHLVFYCGPNSHEQIDRIFRASFAGFRPDKWDKRHYGNGETYGEHTIKMALEDRTEFYTRPLVWRPSQHEPLTDEDDAEETEEEENDRVMKEERPVDETYPCPAYLFRGPFRRVAEEMGKSTWEVWAATLVALGAKAHRNIAYRYHRMLYGMVYALLIKGTGMGKGLSTDLCRGLMPDWYVIRDAVQSGPALAPILADIVRGQKGKVESCTPHPALLLIEEYTVLLKNAGIQHSTLIDSLNSLFHRPWPWNISRSDRPNSGGGDVVIKDPTLSILATTTEALFKEYVSPQMIRSGFLNRFFVLPGDTTPWKFYDPDGAGKIIQQNLGILDYIPMRKVGDGKTIWDAYEPPALERIKSWGEQTFEPIMQSSELEAESVKRLHVYAHVIGLLYAWGDQRDLVNLDDVECSIFAIETSQQFLQSLIAEDREPEIPKFKAYEMNLEQRILTKVTEAAAQGIRRRSVVRSLQRHATTPDLYLFITKMVQVGTLREVAEMTEGAKKPVHKLYLPEHNPERKKRQKNED